jgi:inorganic phosphate transporter, PiT family
MSLAWLLLASFLVAYANGANDNFKGVATLYGSGGLSYRAALAWGTITTFAGAAAAALLGGALARAFSGQELVPQTVAGDPRFLIAVGGGAALNVLLASRLGLPISTTHSLLGGLLGAGVVQAGAAVRWPFLLSNLLAPLLLSPLLAMGLTLLLYPVFRLVRRATGIGKETCLCVGSSVQPVAIRADGVAVLKTTGVAVEVADLSACRTLYAGRLFGVSAQAALDRLHLLSGGAVGFARGLNDTPKIAALLIAAPLAMRAAGWYLAVAAVMAAGGLLGARRVAETMGHRITGMNDGQGFSANLATALLVILASRFGLPVSTTHVSVGALFGLGLWTRRARVASILTIVAAWVVTLPLAALLSALLACLLRR